MMKFGLISLPLSLLLMDYWYLCMWKSIHVLFADWSQISQTNSASAESFGGTSFPFMPCSSWPVHTSTDIHILDVNCCSSEQSHEPRHSPYIWAGEVRKSPVAYLLKAEKGLFAGLFSEHFYLAHFYDMNKAITWGIWCLGSGLSFPKAKHIWHCIHCCNVPPLC